MSDKHYQLHATDSMIKRNRAGRVLVVFMYVLVTCLLPILAWRVFNDWFEYGKLGFLLGLAGQTLILSNTLHHFMVKVGALRAFITVDQLRTLLNRNDNQVEGDKDAYVVYGPGFHFAYPWESRSANYNVSLEEASEDFSVDVQTAKGLLKVNGSVRMRPDITRLIPFIGGVAAMAGDITGIIKSFVIELLSKEETVKEALKSVPRLNEELEKKFGFGSANDPDPKVSEFEGRFGVSVGDVTISTILPSLEVQKTMSGVTEAEIIADATAIMLGYTSLKGVRQAISKGLITQEDFNKARDRFMAASDNIKMNLDANEYTVRIDGLDPDIAKALAAVAPMLLGTMGQNKPTRKGK